MPADLFEALPVQRRHIRGKFGAGGMGLNALIEPAVEASLRANRHGLAVLVSRSVLVAMAVVAIASGVPAVLLRQEKQESTVGNGHAGNAAAERPDLGKKLVAVRVCAGGMFGRLYSVPPSEPEPVRDAALNLPSRM